MIKIDINFDVIDKTFEARGKHNVRRWLRLNKAYDVVGLLYPTIQGTLALYGIQPVESSIMKSLGFAATAAIIWPALDLAKEIIQTKTSGLDYKQRAYVELLVFSIILSNLGIKISPEQMMEAKIYKKKYKLAMDGRAGIIRERYFDVPFTDKTEKERITSVKEEHILGTKKYLLSLDQPTEQKEYKLAYNM